MFIADTDLASISIKSITVADLSGIDFPYYIGARYISELSLRLACLASQSANA